MRSFFKIEFFFLMMIPGLAGAQNYPGTCGEK